MISIELNKQKLDNVQKMIELTPLIMRSVVRHWMYSERKKFIGSKDSPMGKFRKTLRSIQLSRGTKEFTRTGKWPENVVKSFKGYLSGKENIDTMQMRMGIGLEHPNKFTKGMSALDASVGGATFSSSNAMPLPVYRNLKKYGTGGYYKLFQRMVSEGKLFARKMANGTVLWFDKSQIVSRTTANQQAGDFKRSALMFLGKRTVKVKPKFDYYGQWQPQRAGTMNRLKTLMNRELRALNLGYKTEKDFTYG